FIVYMGNNEAIGLYAPEPGSRNWASRRVLLRLGQRVKRTKLYQLLESALSKVKKSAPPKKQDMEFFRNQRFSADAPAREVIYANFQANLEGICRLSERSRVKALVSTVGVNFKDFPPL